MSEPVQIPNVQIVPQLSGVLLIPKININGEFIPQTMIFLHKITGSQPCEISYKGKTLPGMKIYTSEGNFKSPITVQELGAACAKAIFTGECQTIAPPKAMALASNGQKAKALKSKF